MPSAEPGFHTLKATAESLQPRNAPTVGSQHLSYLMAKVECHLLADVNAFQEPGRILLYKLQTLPVDQSVGCSVRPGTRLYRALRAVEQQLHGKPRI